MAQAQRHIVAAQQPATVHRTHVGRRGAHHFDETAHGRRARRTGQRVSSLVGRHNGRLPVRGCRGRRRPERRRRKRLLRTNEKIKIFPSDQRFSARGAPPPPEKRGNVSKATKHKNVIFDYSYLIETLLSVCIIFHYLEITVGL